MQSDPAIECARFDEGAWLLISGELDDDARKAWEHHLAGCPACARRLAERRHILDLYDALLPQPEPSSTSRRLPDRPSPWRRRLIGVAAALALTGGGAAVGLTVAGANEAERLRQAARQAADLEVQVAVARLAPSTAAERLRAARAGGALVDRDPRIVDSLVDVLETDSSPNVRMAALDALYSGGGAAAVERRFARLIAAQGSPVLRVALIDLAAERRLTGALGELRRLAGTSSDREVRARAQWAVDRLGRGL